MPYFERYFIRFECHPQSNQLSIIFTPPMELIFETLEKTDIDMNPYHSMIETIFNRKFGNTSHNKNEPNNCQYTNNITVRNNNIAPLYNIISTEPLANNINI